MSTDISTALEQLSIAATEFYAKRPRTGRFQERLNPRGEPLYDKVMAVEKLLGGPLRDDAWEEWQDILEYYEQGEDIEMFRHARKLSVATRQDTPESLDEEVEKLISRGEDIGCRFETTGNGWGFTRRDY